MPESLARNLTKIYQFYPVDPPQEFDEPGKELGPDAQVWKTYVREADQVDEEKVDGWNKSMDVILIFAALFSAISTAFVIESYKNLKPDPADVSSRTLLTISQTLAAIANGSQPAGSQSSSDTEVDDPPFSASWSAICVNVLWFLSLSLSVAVSLISMLAKEWCLKFMSNRTGPPGLQARRRQLRWEKLVSWRMEEVLMILPSLIHLSLLLFAIGLSVFLWDVHFGVAIPVVFVTTVAAAAYVTCTVLPFVDKYCPYGTVLSILCRRFIELRERTTYTSGDLAQDETTAKSLVWMIENCETPRSVDVALQSLAGATKGMPYKPLAEWDVWTMIKRRLGAQDPSAQNAAKNRGDSAHAKALLSVTSCRDNDGGLEYGSKPEARRLEALALGLQSCIDR
ncbi:transmembrane protein, putative, partial [Rhizoctonia solani AG-3 Rhs1AP]